MVTGAVVQIALGEGIGETDIATLLAAVPGTAAGLRSSTRSGVRQEAEAAEA